MYAIIETGGKQYRVQEGTRLKVESLAHPKGEQFLLDRVLLVAQDQDVKIGKPLVAGFKVTAEVVDHDREKKVIVFKKRSKKTYKKWIGHRQNYTELLIKSISATPA